MALAENLVLAAFGAMLCWGIGDFLIQKSVRKIGDIETLAFIGIVGAVGLLPFIAQDFHKLSQGNVLFLAGIGIVTFIVAVLNFEALKQGKLSVVEVILELELPVTVILGFIFLRESLTLAQLAVISTVFIGIMLMATRHLSIGHFARNLERGAMIAGASAIGMGLVNFLTGVGAKGISPIMVIWVPWIGFTALCLAYLWKKGALRELLSNASKYPALLAATGAFDTAAWLLFAIAVSGSQISLIIGVTESYPAIAIALGVWLNKESVMLHQYFGAALAIASSIALALII
ncbi:MAG: DMT family transporter [Candidatus Diapherotrites archaeon]|uniref:DMT family transporter n=1 Tax=Candidatus Iainarchaeum sp. TaxID=3101447 RepID=A0A8T3YK08_9ARCH|nr:DMT family transporter [Candidatus Diapherotrites archaeon]